MARNSVALNLGSAGEQPGASRVAEFLACCISRSVWYCPCNPYVQKTPAPSPRGVCAGGEGGRGLGVFGKAVTSLDGVID
jgi:hypothetical protein